MPSRPRLVFLLLLLATPVQAAEIEHIPLNQRPGFPAELQAIVGPGCGMRLSGTIETGDLDRFPLENARVLCLDSPGGNLAEALRIAEYLQEQRIGTQLTEAAVCLSSCAVIFMAGTSVADDDYTFPLRIMHPTAQLGFHAPRLVPREGEYSAENVERAYTLALATLSGIIQILGQQRSDIVPPRVKPSLIARILDTPSDRIELVDTVDKAGRWGITVWPIANEPRHIATFEDIYRACINRLFWDLDLSSPEEIHILYHAWEDDLEFEWASILRVVVDEITGLECSFTMSRDSAAGDSISRADQGFFHAQGDYPGSRIDRFPPSTRLTDLD